MRIVHPLVPGAEIAIRGRSRRLRSPQYALLCEELCSLAFCFPHLVARVRYLAGELELPEVIQYAAWCEERRKAGAA